jgi:hypothetical protein
MIFLLFWIAQIFLKVLTPTVENHPAIERGCALLTTAARLDSERIGSTFDNVTESNLLVTNETRKMYSIRRAFTLIWCLGFCHFLFHETRFGTGVVAITWYAAHASNKGGTTVDRPSTCARVKAIFNSAAVAFGNIDFNNAMAPVTNGAAALVPPNVGDLALVPRLVMPSPGALSPRRPIEFPKFE